MSEQPKQPRAKVFSTYKLMEKFPDEQGTKNKPQMLQKSLIL
jgi:hypothetical protein